ncbi:MAG: hypothetical protein ACKV2V_22520 [Blastocatellia bacterium]
MFEAFVWIGALAILFGVIAMLVRENQARAEMTEEEWENREREGSLLGASAFALDSIIRPDMERAQAVQMDMRGGHYLQDEQAGEKVDEEEAGDEKEPAAEATLRKDANAL